MYCFIQAAQLEKDKETMENGKKRWETEKKADLTEMIGTLTAQQDAQIEEIKQQHHQELQQKEAELTEIMIAKMEQTVNSIKARHTDQIEEMKQLHHQELKHKEAELTEMMEQTVNCIKAEHSDQIEVMKKQYLQELQQKEAYNSAQLKTIKDMEDKFQQYNEEKEARVVEAQLKHRLEEQSTKFKVQTDEKITMRHDILKRMESQEQAIELKRLHAEIEKLKEELGRDKNAAQMEIEQHEARMRAEMKEKMEEKITKVKLKADNQMEEVKKKHEITVNALTKQIGDLEAEVRRLEEALDESVEMHESYRVNAERQKKEMEERQIREKDDRERAEEKLRSWYHGQLADMRRHHEKLIPGNPISAW